MHCQDVRLRIQYLDTYIHTYVNANAKDKECRQHPHQVVGRSLRKYALIYLRLLNGSLKSLVLLTSFIKTFNLSLPAEKEPLLMPKG